MKKILFVIDSITCGGAERALMALLKELDYSKYEVDLLYFNHENEYFKDSIPSQVNILKPDVGMQIIFSSPSLLKKYLTDFKFLPLLFLRYVFGLLGKLNSKNYFKKRVKDWKKYRLFIPKIEKQYDASIAFLENISTYYVLDKTIAKKYIVWQRTDYLMTGCNPKWDLPYFEKADNVCVLSEEMKNNFVQEFPQVKNKVIVFPNVIDIASIIEKSNQNIEFDNSYDGFKITSSGTLRAVKGYDVAMKACKILKDKGYKFRWYILGSGEEKEKMELEIKQLNLEDTFILLGNKRNPYPYIKKSDIYVQCSYREGFSTTVFEAKCLQKPIVITDARGMRNQIEHNVNGLIAPVGDSQGIADNIEILFNSKEKRDSFSKELEKHLQEYSYDTQKKLQLFEQLV